MLKALMAIGSLQFLAMVLLLIRTKLLAVWLGPDAVGVMGVVDKLMAVIAQTVSLSLPFAAVRFLPELERDPAALRRVAGSMTRLLALLIGVTTLVTCTVVVAWPASLPADLRPHRDVVFAASLTLPLVGFVPYLQNLLAGTLRHNASMVFAVGNAAAIMVAGVVGGALSSLSAVYVCYGVLGGAFAVATLAWSRRELGAPVAGEPRAGLRQLPPRIWTFAGALLLLTFLSPYSALYAHYAVLSGFGEAAAGWMQAAIGISLAVRAVLGTAHQVLLTPHVNRGGSAAERMRWVEQFQRTWCFLAAVLVPPLLLVPDLFVEVLYAETFAPGARFVYLFVVAEVLGILAGSYQSLIVAFDRLRFHVLQNLTASGLAIAVAAVSVPRFGIVGAGLAAIASQVLLYVCTTWYLARRFGVRPAARTNAITLYVMVALAAGGAWSAGSAHVSVATLVTALAAYVAVLGGLALFLEREDLARLRALARGGRA